MPNKPLSNEKDGVKINADKLGLFPIMPDIVAGKVIKAVAIHEQHNRFDKIAGTYTNDYTPDFPTDSQEYAFYQPMKNMLDSNNRTWLNKCIKDRENGLKGGHPKHKKPTGNPTEPTGNPSVTENNPTKPDNVNVNDNDIQEKVNDNVIIPIKSISDLMTDEEESEIRRHLDDSSFREVRDIIDEAFEGKDLRTIKNCIGYFRSTAKKRGYQWR